MMTQQTVRALFVYEPDTGMLRRIDEKARKPYPWRSVGRGKRVSLGYYATKDEAAAAYAAGALKHAGSFARPDVGGT